MRVVVVGGDEELPSKELGKGTREGTGEGTEKRNWEKELRKGTGKRN